MKFSVSAKVEPQLLFLAELGRESVAVLIQIGITCRSARFQIDSDSVRHYLPTLFIEFEKGKN